MNVRPAMSARKLGTSCALVLLFIVSFAWHADAAPKASTKMAPAPARATKRAASPTKPEAIAPIAGPSVSAPATPAPSLAPSPAPALSLSAAPAPAPSPSPALSPSPDADHLAAPSSPLHHRATITLNPLALAIGRYGANAELVFAPHHAITASGYLQTFPEAILRRLLPDVPYGSGPRARVGGEIGYRLYTGRDGPTGIFVGPSFVLMPLAAPRLAEDYRAEIVSFTAYGAALDVGVQAVIGPGFTLGGGLGVMALAYSPPASAAPPTGIELPTYPEPHVLPRVLVAAGWAF